jgi:hypothetical protein
LNQPQYHNSTMTNPIYLHSLSFSILNQKLTPLKSPSHPTEDLRGDMQVAPAKKLEDLIHLAELCVDLLQQNEEHYAEVSVPLVGSANRALFQTFLHCLFSIITPLNLMTFSILLKFRKITSIILLF